MKRLFAIILLLLFLFNTLGYYLVFSYNQFVLRTEIRTLIKSHLFDNACAVLQIDDPLHNKDFRRLNEEEFRYKGVLYDIVSEETNSSGLTIRCIIDCQEDNLIAGFSHSQEFLNGQNTSASSKYAAAMLRHVITLALVESSFVQPQQTSSDIRYFMNTFSIFSIMYPPLYPPPENQIINC